VAVSALVVGLALFLGLFEVDFEDFVEVHTVLHAGDYGLDTAKVAPFDFFTGVSTDSVPEFFKGVGDFKSLALEDGFLVVSLENNSGLAVDSFHITGKGQIFKYHCV
jgi:hypothetical protein